MKSHKLIDFKRSSNDITNISRDSIHENWIHIDQMRKNKSAKKKTNNKSFIKYKNRTELEKKNPKIY